MNKLPPKSLKSQLVKLDHNLKDIERSQFAGIQRAPGSLPVLEAFQGFLNQERKAARRRLVVITTLCIFVILLISGAGATFIYMQMKHMSVDYTTLSSQANQLESQLKTENITTQTQLTALEEYLNNNAAKHTQLLAAHSNVATQATQDSKQISEMQISLSNLAKENRALKSQIDNIIQNWQTIKQSSESEEQKSVGARPASPSEPKANTTTPETTSNQASSIQQPATSSINLTIVPPNKKTGIRWRLPRIPQ